MLCHYAKCRYADCRYAECRHADCHYAECCHAESNYAECRGTVDYTEVLALIRKPF
jgi:hypothetical protein